MQTRLVEKQNFYAKPFLKWIGGKGQLLKEIESSAKKLGNNNFIEKINELKKKYQ